MASACFNVWRLYQNGKGQKKWVNEGPAPDGVCPSCPNMQYPEAGKWNGYSASCQNGAIVRMVADGAGGLKPGAVIQPATSDRAKQACVGNLYIAGGRITDYFA